MTEKLFLNNSVFSVYALHDKVQIKKAVDFAISSHQDQLRQSGEPYITHPLKVAEILLNLKVIPVITLSGILHDVLEDTEKTFKDLENMFGFHVAKIVNTVSKSRKIEILDHGSEEERKLLHHQFLDTIKDPMATLVKIADRLHNMRTLEFTDQEKKVRKSLETIKMYYPLALEVGLPDIAEELLVISKKYLEHDKVLKAIEISKQYEEEIKDKGYHKNAIDHCVMEI
jgi:GTP pyrophosphokinase